MTCTVHQLQVSKKRTRRNQKFQRAVAGTTLSDIMAKRNQKPEVRKAQREQAIRFVCMGFLLLLLINFIQMRET